MTKGAGTWLGSWESVKRMEGERENKGKHQRAHEGKLEERRKVTFAPSSEFQIYVSLTISNIFVSFLLVDLSYMPSS